MEPRELPKQFLWMKNWLLFRRNRPDVAQRTLAPRVRGPELPPSAAWAAGRSRDSGAAGPVRLAHAAVPGHSDTQVKLAGLGAPHRNITQPPALSSHHSSGADPDGGTGQGQPCFPPDPRDCTRGQSSAVTCSLPASRLLGLQNYSSALEAGPRLAVGNPTPVWLPTAGPAACPAASGRNLPRPPLPLPPACTPVCGKSHVVLRCWEP